MVSLDSVDDNGLLAITTGELGADDGMRALDVVVNCLAQVVKQTGALGGHNVQAKLGSHHAAEIIEMGQKVRRSGMALSVTAITGLGGPELLEEHAVKTAEAFNAMNPEYIGMLTLMVDPGTPL